MTSFITARWSRRERSRVQLLYFRIQQHYQAVSEKVRRTSASSVIVIQQILGFACGFINMRNMRSLPPPPPPPEHTNLAPPPYENKDAVGQQPQTVQPVLPQQPGQPGQPGQPILVGQPAYAQPGQPILPQQPGQPVLVGQPAYAQPGQSNPVQPVMYTVRV